MFYVLSFLFGASIGSFVLVIATRLNVAPILKSRSKCLSCGEALRVYDLIPFFSYIFLRGKCRYCSSPFGFTSLSIEIVYGVLYVALYHFFLLGEHSQIGIVFWLLYYSLLFIVMGVIALYDLKHTYLPVPYLLGYCVLTLGMLSIRYMQNGTGFTLLAPVVVALPFMLLWLVSRGKWLGFGDVILFLGVGAFFGIEQGFAVLLLSVWMGALVGVVEYFVYQKNLKSRALPFVPFIIISFIIVLFTDIDIFSIASLFA